MIYDVHAARLDQNRSGAVASLREAQAMIELPRTPLDMLKNFKTAFDHNLVLDDDFYTNDDRLKLLSGGQTIRKYEDSNYLGISISDFRESTGIPLLTAEGFPVTQYSVSRIISPPRKAVVHGHISFQEYAERGLSFDSVQAIFGKDWIDFPLIPHPPTWAPPRATHPRGNGRIRYLASDCEFSREIVLRFFHDGSLQNCTIRLESE